MFNALLPTAGSSTYTFRKYMFETETLEKFPLIVKYNSSSKLADIYKQLREYFACIYCLNFYVENGGEMYFDTLVRKAKEGQLNLFITIKRDWSKYKDEVLCPLT